MFTRRARDRLESIELVGRAIDKLSAVKLEINQCLRQISFRMKFYVFFSLHSFQMSLPD